jgi:hypothetical protein
MNLTIELSDQKAEALRSEAAAFGLTVDQWVAEIAEQFALSQPIAIAHLQKTDPKESQESVTDGTN